MKPFARFNRYLCVVLCALVVSGCAHKKYQTPPEIAATGEGREPATLNILPTTSVSSGAVGTAGLISTISQEGGQVIQMGDSVRIILFSDRLFESGSIDIERSQHALLDSVTRLLKQYANSTIHITGYTDNVGSPKANIALSRAQARSVLTYFWTHGVPASRLMSDGKGSAQPIASTHTPTGDVYNRRIEITARLSCTINCD